jgi:hypothetical protein
MKSPEKPQTNIPELITVASGESTPQPAPHIKKAWVTPTVISLPGETSLGNGFIADTFEDDTFVVPS